MDADLQQQPAELAEAQASETGRAETEQVNTRPSETFRLPKSPEGLARQRAGRVSGGKRQRAVALIGLGVDVPAINLRDADAQLALLEAVASAVVQGKTSGLVASTLVAIVKAANQVVTTDQGAQIAALVARIEDLVAGRTVTVRR